MRPFVLLLALAGCSSDPCGSCPEGTECIAERCRTPCATTANCDAGEVCFRDYCEVGDLRPGAGDPTPGDPLAGDPLAGDPPPGDPLVGDPAPACGNNRIDSGERCDGSNLNGRVDCTDFNWGSGPISCMVTCAEFDLSACLNPPGKCGSGTPTGMQQCDGSDLRSETCESLGFSSGELACNLNCSFDVSGCVL